MLDYTIESPDADMYQIALYKTGATSPALKIPITDAAQRRTFSGKFKLYAKDLGAGTTSYRIWAYDKDGVYLGDGGKLISITVTPDLLFFTNRRIYVADSMDKTDECYLSISDGKLYSYTTAASHSATIDLGSFTRKDTVRNASGAVTSVTVNNYFYSLSSDPLPFGHYDISSWTKRATLFSAPATGSIADFNNNLNTGAKILAAAKTKTINLKNITTALAANQLIYFKTPEEKYGVIFVHALAVDYRDHRYTQVSYKIVN
ncbi:hypothetical protein [Niabella hibiscisoli]|uniref:hypothetical protein n=1 Tax=Niabella hibiscisoli TaxID=1825928 RepID=UPI001F0EF7B0|nr:hypothetical protein [Niabella hibiscisoli]MCH5720278.1 hypothetical protein [Niabella hibiscisoli]